MPDVFTGLTNDPADYPMLRDPESASPDLYITGNALTRSYTLTPPEVSFWGATFTDKRVLADFHEPENFATIAGDLLSSATTDLGNRNAPSFTSVGSAILRREAVDRRPGSAAGAKSGWDFLQRLAPVQDWSDIEMRVSMEDPTWDPDDVTQRYISNPDNQLTMQTVKEQLGINLEAELRGSRNRDHFMFLEGMTYRAAVSQLRANEFEKNAGTGSFLASRVISGAFNYILSDPTVIVGAGAATPTRAIGSTATRLRAAVQPAAIKIGGRDIGLQAGRAVSSLSRSPLAVHTELTSLIGYRAAVATELAASGAILSTPLQLERMQDQQTFFTSPEHQQQWSWAELGLSMAIPATFGYALARPAGRSSERMLRGVTEAAGGGIDDPISRSLEYMPAQHRVDHTRIRISRATRVLVGDAEHDEFGMYLDPGVMIDNGISPFQVADALDDLALASPEGMPKQAVHAFMTDLYLDARAAKGLSDGAGGAAGTQLERIAWAESLGRASRDLPPTATNQEVTQRAIEIMPEELTRQQSRIDNHATRAKARQNPDAPDVPTVSRQEVINRQPEGIDREVARSLVESEGDDYVEVSVPVREIDTDAMSRDGINMDNVEVFSRQDPETAPPVTTGTFGGSKLDIIDGRHRTLAAILRARNAGANPLDAQVKVFAPRKWAESRGLVRRSRSPDRQAREITFWKQEVQDLMTAASRRSLLDEEMDRLAEAGGMLEWFGERNPMEGFALSRVSRYEDGSIYSPYRPRKNASEATKTVQKITTEARTIREFREDLLSALPQNKAAIQKQIKNSQSRLRRARKKLDDQFPQKEETGEFIEDIKDDVAAEPPKNAEERRAALDRVVKARDFNDNSNYQDTSMLARVLGAVGGGLLRRIAESGTGITQTQRSTLGLIREVAAEIDNTRLRAEDLNPNRTEMHRTMEMIRHDVQQMISEIADTYKSLHDAGKFGTAWNFKTYRQNRREFDRKILRALAGEEADDTDAVRIAELWKTQRDDVLRAADEAGIDVPADARNPVRYNIGKTASDPEGFKKKLARHFYKAYREKDEVNIEALEEMGFTREVLQREFGSLRITKEQLRARELFGFNEDAYRASLNKTGEDGFTPVERQAQRVYHNIHNRDVYQRDKGKLVVRTREELDELGKEIEGSLWLNRDMEPYMNWDFTQVGIGWLQTEGFRHLNDARHSQRWGIPGLRMQETMSYLQERADGLGTDTLEKAEWQKGITTLREKILFAEGRLPRVVDQTDDLGEWLSEASTSMAGALYGSGIGQTIVSTEVMAQSILRVYDLGDLVSRVADIFTAANPFNENRREMLLNLGLTGRQFQSQTMHRLTNDEMYSNGMDFGPVAKILSPFVDALNAMTARQLDDSGEVVSRGFAVPHAIRAYSVMQLTLGGTDYFTTFARLLSATSQQREFGRFFKAAERTAAALRENADELETIRIEQGKDAAFRKWKGIVRQNGFSGRSWQVAERMARAGLLDSDRLATLRKAGQTSGALRDTGEFRIMDFNTLSTYLPETAEESRIFDESYRAMRDMFLGRMKQEVSEAGIMTTPTGSTSRTWRGRVGNAMTSYSRSWHYNNVMNSSQVPLRSQVGLMSAFLVGESINSILRELWKGRDIEETTRDIREDPDNFAMRALTRLPLAGAWSSPLMAIGDSLTRNRRIHGVSIGQSAATGATSSAVNMVLDTVHAATSEEEEISRHTYRNAARFFPGYRSWWSSLLIGGAEKLGAVEYSQLPGSVGSLPRPTNRKGTRVGVDPIPEFFLEDAPRADIPDDFEALLPASPLR